LFYKKEIQGLITEGDKLIIKTEIQNFPVDNIINEKGFRFFIRGLKT
jgi:hypothetical protein